MKLIFRGHDDRYAVEQSLLAFFPEERPVYEPAEDGEDHALVTLSRSPRYNTAVTTITYHGRTARGISRTAVDPQLTEYEAERLRQKAVKLSFFKAAREITGITPKWGVLTGIRPVKLVQRRLDQGLSREEVARELREDYLVSQEKLDLAFATQQKEHAILSRNTPDSFSLYISIPFCPSRCLYCSFVSHSIEKTYKLMDQYIDCLCQEIAHTAEVARQAGLRLRTVYFGGGTPSFFGAENLEKILDELQKRFHFGGGVGIHHRSRPSRYHHPGETPGDPGRRGDPHQHQSPDLQR